MSEAKLPQMVLTLTDPVNWSMNVGMTSVPGIDFALNMLSQATRMLEAERRKVELLEMAKEQEKVLYDEQIRDMISRKQ